MASQLDKIWSKINRGALPLVVLIGAIGVFALMVALRPEVKTLPPQERIWYINATKVQLTDIEPTLHVFGEIVAGRRVELRALVAGEIVEAHPDLRNGGIVEKDDHLLRIDPFTYQTAVEENIARLSETQAKLEELLAQKEQENNLLKRAEEQAVLRARDLKRAEKLTAVGHMSEKTLDDKKLAYSQQLQMVEMHKSSLAIQEARLTQQEGAVARSEIALALAERDLDRTLLKAPFRGFLNKVAAGAGRHVNLNDRIAELTDADQLEARFHLSDAQFGRIVSDAGTLKGQDVKISWQIGKATLIFEGRIIRIGAEISQVAGGISVFASVTVPNFDSALRPGAFVRVHLPDRIYKNVARLPAEALYEGNIVYAIVNERLEPRAVEIAAQIGEDIIVQAGLKNGEEIMTTWFAEAGPGTKVLVPNATPKPTNTQ